MLTHIFYVAGILPFIFEFTILQNAREAFPVLKDEKNKNALATFMLYYSFWTFLGLFSSQWILFLAIIILSLCMNRTNRKTVMITRIDAGITVALMLAIYLNKYHFHYHI